MNGVSIEEDDEHVTTILLALAMVTGPLLAVRVRTYDRGPLRRHAENASTASLSDGRASEDDGASAGWARRRRGTREAGEGTKDKRGVSEGGSVAVAAKEGADAGDAAGGAGVCVADSVAGGGDY